MNASADDAATPAPSLSLPTCVSSDLNYIFSEETNAVRLWCLSTEDILFDQVN